VRSNSAGGLSSGASGVFSTFTRRLALPVSTCPPAAAAKPATSALHHSERT